ncbi:putative subtilisin-like proteinase 2 [Nosema granulosis]|uniref:Subtilisin-like proteinase 2 n=1 Tax=Nosema granulosis TaxID=83296 RepID=A0A9P6GZJ1_9MICR|nr:putative subtilisin-like proteinase 2 [Nosema granulosis]
MILLLLFIVNFLGSSDSEQNKEEVIPQEELIKDVIVEVTTTKTVVKQDEKTVTEHLVILNDANSPKKIEQNKDTFIDPIIVKENNLYSYKRKKKCYLLTYNKDSKPVLDLIKSKNISIVKEFNTNTKGISFCVEDDSIIDALRNHPNVTHFEEDKIYKASSIQYPISRHLFLINNYLNYVFNSYFFDNAVFRALQIDKLFRYLLGSYNYYYSGKGTRLYMLDTTVDVRHNVVNMSMKDKSCHEHGNTALDMIVNKTKGFASDAKVVVLDGVDCDGTISLSGILHQLEQINPIEKSTLLLFGVSGPHSELLNEAVDTLSKKGLIVISPSGNNHDNGCYYSPGSAKTSLTVGSLDKHANISEFSNFGSCVRVYSLGEEISYTKNTRGTSYSAATVASAILMFLEKYPVASFDKVWEFINANSYLNGNTHLVFKIPFLSKEKTTSFSSDSNRYGLVEIYVYYVLPVYLFVGILFLMYWLYNKMKRRNTQTRREYIIEPNLRHH